MKDHDKPSADTLDEATKARIRAEEQYRAQMRAEAEPVNPPPPAPKQMRSFRLESGSPGQGARAARGLLILAVAGGVYWWLAQPHGVATIGGSVVYSVTSSCPVDVTYTTGGTDIQQESKVPSGWTKTVDQSSLTNQLSAQLSCAGGTVTASIARSGETPKTATSSGDYTIASLSYP
jgi:hypothetical protein